MAEVFANNASSFLNATITSSQTTLVVTSTTNFSTTGNFRLCVDTGVNLEYMIVTGVSGSTFTVIRGQEGTTGVAHNAGVQVTQVLTAGAVTVAQNQTTGWYGNNISSSAPTDAQIPVYVNGTTTWTWTTVSGDATITHAGVVTVGAIQGNTVTSGALVKGQFLIATTTSNWASTSLSGDVSESGTTPGLLTVTGLQGVVVPAPSGSSTVLTYNSGTLSWATGGGGGSVTWANDLVNSTSTNQYVSSLSYSSSAAGGTIAINGTGSALQWANGNTAPAFNQAALGTTSASSGTAGSTFTISAQAGQAATGAGHTGGAGGSLVLSSGVGGTSGSSTTGAGGSITMAVAASGAGAVSSSSQFNVSFIGTNEFTIKQPAASAWGFYLGDGASGTLVTVQALQSVDAANPVSLYYTASQPAGGGASISSASGTLTIHTYSAQSAASGTAVGAAAGSVTIYTGAGAAGLGGTSAGGAGGNIIINMGAGGAAAGAGTAGANGEFQLQVNSTTYFQLDYAVTTASTATLLVGDGTHNVAWATPTSAQSTPPTVSFASATGHAAASSSGAGGAFTLTAGSGTVASSGTSAGGVGGAFTLKSGAGAAGLGGTSSGGAGGLVSITGAAGGAAVSTGTGGAGAGVTVTTGAGGTAAGAGTGGASGAFTVAIGAVGTTTGGTSGALGKFIVSYGGTNELVVDSGVTTASTSTVTLGDGTNAVTLVTPTSLQSSAPTLSIVTGAAYAAASVSGAGGQFSITTGNGTVASSGTAVGGHGGNVVVTTGTGAAGLGSTSNGGAGGNYTINTGAGGAHASGGGTNGANGKFVVTIGGNNGINLAGTTADYIQLNSTGTATLEVAYNDIFYTGTPGSDVAAATLTISAQNAYTSAVTNINGGTLALNGGSSTSNGTTGVRGGVQLQISGAGNLVAVECAEVAVGRRVVSLAQMGSGVTSTNVPASGGDGVIFIGNCQTAPVFAGKPASGYVLFASGGALKGIGTSGTITTMGPAEPHCPSCGSDYMIEHENPKYGYHAICMKCLGDNFGEQPWIMRKKGV